MVELSSDRYYIRDNILKLYNNKNTKNLDTPTDTPKMRGCRWTILDGIGWGKGRGKIRLL
jgi:hypothetical protein